MTFFTPLGDFLDATGEAGLAHSQGMQRNVRATPGITGRRKVVGIDFPFDLEHLDGDRFGYFRLVGEPLGIGPGFNDLLCSGIAL